MGGEFVQRRVQHLPIVRALTSPPLTARQAIGAHSLALIASVGVFAFAAIILLLHALESESSPTEHMVSEYALGDYGFLLTAAAFLLALGSAALAIGFRQALRPKPFAPTVLLAIWSSGAVVAGLFNTDPKGTVETSTNGEIHTLAVSVAVLALTCAAFLFGQHFQRNASWSSKATTTRCWALAMLLATGATMLTAESEVGGIVQRVWIAVLIGWLIFVANHLRSVTPAVSESHSPQAHQEAREQRSRPC